MFNLREKVAQQKLVKVLNTFKDVIECQDKQIKDLYDRLEKIENALDHKKDKNDSDSNKR